MKRKRHGLPRRRGLKPAPSLAQAVPIASDDSQHRRKPRTGKKSPITYSQPQEWPESVYEKATVVKPGEGYNNLRRKMNMMDLSNYEQPIIDPETGKMSRAKFQPLVNKLGNTPDVGEVEANIQANERMAYNEWAVQMIWNQEGYGT